MLQGPFHTRGEAARLAGVPMAELVRMPGAVRLDGPMSLEEVYPAFQFGRSGGFVPGLVDVVARLDLPGREAAAWLVTLRPVLGSRSVVDWLTEGRPLERITQLMDGGLG